MHMYVHMYVCMYICNYVYMFVCMYVFMYVCTLNLLLIASTKCSDFYTFVFSNSELLSHDYYEIF